MYKLLWDTIINEDEGPLEDPRYMINKNHGHMNFGFVLTNPDGSPAIEETQVEKMTGEGKKGAWHIWRLCEPHGWAHIIKLESTDPYYLDKVLNRLHLQAEYTNKYGFHSYNRLLESLEEEEREQLQKDKEEVFNATQDENAWLMHKAKENFKSGKTAPTNPKKEVIFSASGISNRSKIVRPLSDEEGGIITV
jgi:hypothetical protein